MSYVTESPLKDLALSHPGAMRILESHHLDYCCGGQQSLGDACRAAGLDPDEILKELETVQATPVVETPVQDGSLAEIVRHIVETHHEFTRDGLLRIRELIDRVIRRHSAHHPELASLEHCFRRLADDLLPHMAKEEEILFPYIEALEESAMKGTQPPTACFASVESPIRVMTHEHQVVGDLLKQARRLTQDYSLPGDACASYGLLYRELEGLEADLMRHIHLENNILFPRAMLLAAHV